MYPEPTNLWERIEYSSLGITIAESTWMFPTIETLHVIALVTVIGTIAIVDLRLIGVTGRALRVSQLAKDTLPWTWGAFAAAVCTGAGADDGRVSGSSVMASISAGTPGASARSPSPSPAAPPGNRPAASAAA